MTYLARAGWLVFIFANTVTTILALHESIVVTVTIVTDLIPAQGPVLAITRDSNIVTLIL